MRRAFLVVGAGVGILLLTLALTEVDAPNLQAALSKTEPSLVALGLIAVAATIGAKALRWRLLFYPSHRTLRLSTLLSATLIGQTINFLLPARLGELARAHVVGEVEGQRKVLALGTIVVEKLLDGLMLLLVVGLVLVVTPVPDWLRIASAGSGLAVGGLLAAILLLNGQRERLLGSVDRLCQLVPLFRRFDPGGQVSALADGLSSLRAGHVNLQLVAWSLLIWLLAGLTNYLILLSLKIEVPALSASLLLLAVLHLGLLVPSTPARIGVFHYICFLSLSFFGVERSSAMAYGFVLHAIVVLPIIFVGILCLWRENLNLYWVIKRVRDG